MTKKGKPITAAETAKLQDALGKKRAAEIKKGMAAEKAAAAGAGREKRGAGLGADFEMAQEQILKFGEKNAPALAATLKKYERFTTEIQKLSAVSARGAGQMTQDLQTLQRRNTELGITMETTMQSVQHAMTNYYGVVTTGWKKDYVAVTKQIAVYGKLGVSMTDVTGMMNLFGGSLGKGRAEVTKTAQILNKFAQTTGQSYAQVWSDFNQNVGQFMTVMDSKDMQRQTLLMTTRARRMGVSVNQMMGSLQQFETLEGAQQAAGKINAVMGSLGGSFDAVKAAGMDFTERQQYISKTIQSVYGRIEQSGPRAGRAYIGALADAFGMDARTIKAMATARPGAALPAEIMAGRGLIGGLTTAQTETAAKEAATWEQRTNAMKDAREAFLLEVVPKSLGLSSTEIINQIKMSAGKLDALLINGGANLGDNVAKRMIAGLEKGLPEAIEKAGGSASKAREAMGAFGEFLDFRKTEKPGG